MTRPCRKCGTDLEDALAFTWLTPARGRVIIGYCRTCSRVFEQSEDGTVVHSLTWAPVCHQCRNQVQLDREMSDDEHKYYRCSEHSEELWEYYPAEDEWTFENGD
jgi:hypothetical protein